LAIGFLSGRWQEVSAPMRLDLIATSPYWRVELKDEVASTQLEFGDHPPTSDAGRVVVAEYQSAGRGRLDRSFVSAKSKGLTFSFLLAPSRQESEWSWLPLLVGAATVDAINETAASRFGGAENLTGQFYSKWPNDILASNGKKLGGILLERRGGTVIVGIGINVLHDEASMPLPHATSLLRETGIGFSREELLTKILQSIEKSFLIWQKVGTNQAAINHYCASSLTLGNEVEIELPSREKILGVAQSIREDGALLLRESKTGEMRVISAGDLVHARGNTQIR
jgi:BirA family biotin operon repressor/biotin-[acetyl-CoA-carboxylase] ligase